MASRVMPAVLKVLMRPESIETTLRDCRGYRCHAQANLRWEAFEAARGDLPSPPVVENKQVFDPGASPYVSPLAPGTPKTQTCRHARP